MSDNKNDDGNKYLTAYYVLVGSVFFYVSLYLHPNLFRIFDNIFSGSTSNSKESIVITSNPESELAFEPFKNTSDSELELAFPGYRRMNSKDIENEKAELARNRHQIEMQKNNTGAPTDNLKKSSSFDEVGAKSQHNSNSVDSKVVSFLIEQVQAGSEYAAYDLSKRYAAGVGVPVNVTESGRYRFIACERGSREAQAEVKKIIGEYFYPNENPQATEAEKKSNRYLYNQFQNGSGDAAFLLALRLKDGSGFISNLNESQKLVRIAAEFGNPKAIEILNQNNQRDSDGD